MTSRALVTLLFGLLIPGVESSRPEGPTTQIQVDQAGYLPQLRKLAFLVRSDGNRSSSFELRREEDNKAVLQGQWTVPAFDPDSGDRVQTADFSAWKTSGNYYIYDRDAGRSWPFRIAPDVYVRAYYLTARSFYGQRCGTAVDLGGEFPGYHHDACHAGGAYDASSGRQGPRISSKGWHDAGDYGRYVVNSGISTATLLWAFELWGSGPIQKIALHLPESDGGNPDLLSEARWNIDWMLTMQDTDGGVWQKQTSAHFCGFIPPERDILPSLVIGSGTPPFKTSCATADFTAVMAIAARVFAPYDRSYADRCLAAAKDSWKWLSEHETAPFRNPSGITTGEYGDGDCRDERLWAAAELARTTRDGVYDIYFLDHYREFLQQISSARPPSWADMAAFGLWTYVLGKGQNADAIQEIVSRSTNVADEMVQRAAQAAYQTSMLRQNYLWGSNGVAANYGLQLLVANRLRGDRRYVETAANHLHYLLGANPFSLSYVTQLGAHSVQHIHHRPSASRNLPQPWPGLLSGGPNAGRQDPEMQRSIPPNTPPARAFLDLQGSYASNEVAINWNAPLVFLLAGLIFETSSP